MDHITEQSGSAESMEGLDRQALRMRLSMVRQQIAQLDREEPDDMESEAYAAWGDRHELLEDLADDIQDRLDELGGAHA